MITHLKSTNKRGGKNHFQLRGNPVLGYDWWRVWDFIDRPDEFIGPKQRLPLYALEELSELSQAPLLNSRREARHIEATLCLFAGEDDNGIPHVESVDWLRQYTRPDGKDYTVDHGYMVVTSVPGDETCPSEIWESVLVSPTDVNLLDSEYRLVWKRQEE